MTPISRLSVVVVLTLPLVPQLAEGQVPAIRAGSAEALRATAQTPTVSGPKIGLRDIREGRENAGVEGIPYYGAGELAPGWKNTSTFKVLQVIDDQNLLIDEWGTPWWLEMATAGIADDMKIDLSGKVFKFVGTKRYETNLGSKTVFHLRYLHDADPLDGILPQPTGGIRTWTDTSGRRTFKAKFIDAKDGKLVLEREDGTKLNVPISSMSKKDIEWYKEEVQRRKKAKR